MKLVKSPRGTDPMRDKFNGITINKTLKPQKGGLTVARMLDYEPK